MFARFAIHQLIIKKFTTMQTFKDNMVLAGIPNQEFYWNLIEHARGKGVPIYEETYKEDFSQWPNLVFSDMGYLAGNCSTKDEGGKIWITFDEFFTYCDNWKVYGKKKTRININESYTAEIRDGKVFVGCQTFEFEAIRKLYDAINEQP